ncbi:hypothetical protein BZ335_23325 [Salmonella enterica subsp. enterica serovar Enteritidis]|nr:hypothetical protein [Salmonella enterica subsp. enterica serovar Enteritidis]
MKRPILTGILVPFLLSVQREFCCLSDRFSLQKYPSPKKLDNVIRQLRREAFWRDVENGEATPGAKGISKLADHLEKRKLALEDRWIYRPWLCAETCTFSLPMILICPACLIFIFFLYVGCSVLTIPAVMLGYLACVGGVALWFKDIPGLYWSVYIALSVIGLSFHLPGR